MAKDNMDDINLECENDNDNKISSEKRLVDDIIENNIEEIKKKEKDNKEKDIMFNIKNGLCDLEKTLNGEGYAYSNLTCRKKGIDFIPKSITRYIHLKYINLSHNNINDLVHLYFLPNIMFLDVSYNMLKEIVELRKEYLKNCIYINLSHNLISHMNNIFLKNLLEFNISYNTINNINIYISNTIRILNLSNNNIKNINFKNKLNNLLDLDISFNPIENLDFHTLMPNLVVLRINDNSTISMDKLNNLNNFKCLQSLFMQNYLYFKDISYKDVKEILLQNSKDIHLLKFNGNRLNKKTDQIEQADLHK
ncbi:leucine-rich repeat protein [Plasmodium reichenowi]|uniref:Leucine-rich repeat protein n=1 Tax=Plasmodium reichenowi TaxID=5854 RepID=A0A060RVG7_PLARE|nr:leucine-rich repeat protein [Plasmodium reichenowi]KYN96801.1 leucine-rich repeat protein [Plasmodium reichenowi]CDO65263.1 leucine-rich repeat protein [Plasmodium reichenowi]SOV80388.1 leucine-rich repeat protein [Plasmodium reichenowi]